MLDCTSYNIAHLTGATANFYLKVDRGLMIMVFSRS